MNPRTLLSTTAIAIAAVAAGCGSTDTTSSTEIAAGAQDTAVASTSSAVASTPTSPPTTSSPSTTSTITEAQVDESAVRVGLAVEFLDLMRAGDPALADRMTPDERDRNIFGVTFAQFLVGTWRFNEVVIDGECADIDEGVICEWSSSDDWVDAIGFTKYSRAALEFEDGLVSHLDIRANAGGVYGAMNRWRRANYPDEKACDPDPNDPAYEGMPAGALEWPEGEPIGQKCADLMVRLAPEFAASDSYIPPPEQAG